MSRYAEVAVSQEDFAQATILMKVGLAPVVISALQYRVWCATWNGDVTPFEYLWTLMDKNFADFAIDCSTNDQTSLEKLAGVMILVKQSSNISTPKSFVKAMNFIDNIVLHLSRTSRMDLSLFYFLKDLPISSREASSLNVFHNIHNYETLKSSTENGMFESTVSFVSDSTRLTISRIVGKLRPLQNLPFLADPLNEFEMKGFYEGEMSFFLHNIGFPDEYAKQVCIACGDCKEHDTKKAEYQGGCTYHGLLRIRNQVVIGKGWFDRVPKRNRDMLVDAIDFMADEEGIMSVIHPVNRIYDFDYGAFFPNLKDAGLSMGRDRGPLVLDLEGGNIRKRKF